MAAQLSLFKGVLTAQAVRLRLSGQLSLPALHKVDGQANAEVTTFGKLHKLRKFFSKIKCGRLKYYRTFAAD